MALIRILTFMDKKNAASFILADMWLINCFQELRLRVDVKKDIDKDAWIWIMPFQNCFTPSGLDQLLGTNAKTQDTDVICIEKKRQKRIY